MTQSTGRSTLRLAAGFVAGLGILGGAVMLAPPKGVPQQGEQDPDTSGQSESDGAPTEPQKDVPLRSGGRALAENEAPQDATPEIQDAKPELILVEPQTPDPAVTDVVTEVAPLTPAPEGTERVEAEIPNPLDTAQTQAAPIAPPQTPELEEIPVAEAPARDAVAGTLNLDAVSLEPQKPVQQSAPETPEIVADASPKRATQAPLAPVSAQTPRAPVAPKQSAQAPTEPKPQEPEEVQVEIAPDVKEPVIGESETASRLAAVTGADKAPKQALAASILNRNLKRDPPAASDQTAPPAPPIATGPAFEAFAAEYEDSGERSLLAIILVDPGDEGMDRNFLRSLSFPVTFAIPANAPRAQFIEAEYRTKGFEVLMMVPQDASATLSKTTQPSALPSILEAFRRNVPGAIGFVDAPGGALHTNSRLLRALAGELSETGHALLTNKQRINTSDRVAQEAGIPFAKVLRPIDADGTAPSVRRALERAALTASKAGGAVIIGNSTTDTIKTLYEWLLSNSSRSITVAPVSAVIKRLGNG